MLLLQRIFISNNCTLSFHYINLKGNVENKNKKKGEGKKDEYGKNAVKKHAGESRDDITFFFSY